ncbi:hypothetical protein FEM48_Zijuj09G0053300 [Ziziphus jujuba var. spinosa]|uniref:Uncharacterized protein n=1 Tax=Ziziphus jujuba var. spinosa TaxID=714518 RepID=A0A978UR42_ZIZJJ|nr:hypothetical protein FEM48_Zijuj09G0053300 [Ziziphus jujuba var. spinosa]
MNFTMATRTRIAAYVSAREVVGRDNAYEKPSPVRGTRTHKVAGKKSWPEVVGLSGEVAKAKIEKENPTVTAEIKMHGTSTSDDYMRADRVRVWVDLKGVVKDVPQITYEGLLLVTILLFYCLLFPFSEFTAAFDDVANITAQRSMEQWSRRGEKVTHHPCAMGRLESLWGKGWGEHRPERRLERDRETSKWRFVANTKVDPYTYPVFQAGPRMCLGREMAFLQMKMVVAGVMRLFRVVTTIAAEGVEPVFVTYLTSKMKGRFPARIDEIIN